jgi:hypothetical protein
MDMEEEDDNYPNELETELRVIRLVTGEDLITECTEIDDEGFALLIINPLKLEYFQHSGTGKLSINFRRWFNSMLVDDHIFKIEQNNILTYQFPSKALANKYLLFVQSEQKIFNSASNPNFSAPAEKKEKPKKSVEDELKHLDSLETMISDLGISDFVKNSLDSLGKAKRSRGRPKKKAN